MLGLTKSGDNVSPAVTTADAKAWLNIHSSQTGDDDLIDDMIAGATLMVEALIGQPIMTDSYQQFFSGWPHRSRALSLAIGPVTVIDAVDYVPEGTTDHTYTTIDNDGNPDPVRYYLRGGRPRGVVWFTEAFDFPDLEAFDHEPIRVTYTAGHSGSTAAVPKDLANAVLILATHHYVHREPMAAGQFTDLPYGLQSLLGPYMTPYRHLDNLYG